MKKIQSLVILALTLVSCSVKPEIRKGDLLFVGIPMDYTIGGMAEAISDATGTGEINYIHTAILDTDPDGSIYIIDATIKHGIDRHPLDTFLRDFTLKDGSLPVLEVYRLKDTTGVAGFVENAKSYIGESYDSWFLPGNDKHYCTELVYDSYIRDGEHIFTAAPMNFKNKEGEFPIYWQELFELIHSEIPQGLPGTNPQAMHEEETITFVTQELH